MSDGPSTVLGRTGPATGGRGSVGTERGAGTAEASGEQRGQSGGLSEDSAVRPGRLSATAATLVAMVAVVSLGALGGFLVPSLLAVVGAVLFAAAVALLTAEDPLRVVVGMALAGVASGALVAGASLGPTLAVWPLWIAVFGCAVLRFRSTDRGRVVDAVSVLSYGLVPVWVAAFLAVLSTPLGVFGELIVGTVGVTPESSGLTAASLLVALAALSLRAAFGVVPVVRLAPSTARDRLRPWVGTTERVLWVAGQLAALTVPVVIGLELTVLGSSPELSASIATVAGSATLRAALLATATFGGVVAVTALVVRWAGGSLVERTQRGVAAGAGLCLAAVAATAHGPLLDLLGRVVAPSVAQLIAGLRRSPGGPATTLLAASVALIIVVVTLFLLVVVTDLGVVPARTAEPAVAAAALLAGVALAAGSLPAAAVVGGVAAAMVVWDLGEYAVGVGEEVPGGAPRTETVHAAGSVGVALAVTGLVAGAHALVSRVEPGGAVAAAALAASLVGALAIAAALRR